jgi:hypothetical protein
LLPMILLLDSTIRSLLLSHGSIGTLANSQPHQAPGVAHVVCAKASDAQRGVHAV